MNYTSFLIHEAINLGAQVHVSSFSFASRTKNKVAHELAQLALRVGGERVWHESWPSCVAMLAEQDQFVLPERFAV